MMLLYLLRTFFSSLNEVIATLFNPDFSFEQNSSTAMYGFSNCKHNSVVNSTLLSSAQLSDNSLVKLMYSLIKNKISLIKQKKS